MALNHDAACRAYPTEIKYIDGDVIYGLDGKVFTPDADKLAAAQAELDKLKYKEKRMKAFPTWQEQMDMQYWDAVNGTTTWKDAIAKVKSDNPKPS